MIVKAPLPAASSLWPAVTSGDFFDGYSVESALSPRAAADIGLTMPAWADRLLNLRNALVRPLGLKAESTDSGEGAIFPVHLDTPAELVLGTDDRHLDFRISVMQHAGRIHMGTWVHPHNWAGRAYLALVMPFHVLIVRDALRRIARASIASATPAQ